jgi:RNA polymerase sigma factor (sigma-70 family)
MVGARADTLLHHLRQLVAADSAELPDAQLLERFIARRDGEAFAALVRRHGPLVLGVCRRTLADTHDAEDAFQATFLLLARRAGAVRKRAALGSWLYGVALRLACRARADAARRRKHERAAREEAAPDVVAELSWREVRCGLDEELARLPEAYRAPLLLCYLEGRTQDEAARQLGWGRGVFRRRLEKGRALLRFRLTRRGLALSAGLFAAALADRGTAALPAALATRAVETALRPADLSATGDVSSTAAALARGLDASR